VSIRAFDNEATALQRQGQMALWPPSLGQEAAQVGSGRAARPQDRIFPSYREHVVARIRGIDTLHIIRMMRGLTHGGWNADEFNMQPYTLVLAAQVLHATGYAMGVRFDGKLGTGDAESDEAVLVYFGDGSTSEGDFNESLVYAASYQTPQVFFLQNNHLAISVPVTRQSRTPLYLRPRGFGIPSVRVDGNDVLATYAVTAKYLDDARNGRGPRFIEALTYRMGAHTTSDDPTRYEDGELVASWAAKDPIVRFEAYLRSLDFDQSFFDEVAVEAHDYAEDTRKRTLELGGLTTASMFDNVYTDPHPVTAAQKAWLEQYEASMGAGE
jgi:pyruvate dehydrogenase E1 component alpha subunit